MRMEAVPWTWMMRIQNKRTNWSIFFSHSTNSAQDTADVTQMPANEYPNQQSHHCLFFMTALAHSPFGYPICHLVWGRHFSRWPWIQCLPHSLLRLPHASPPWWTEGHPFHVEGSLWHSYLLLTHTDFHCYNPKAGRPQAAQAGFLLTLQLRLVLNSLSSCLHLPSIRMIDVYHYVQLCLWCWCYSRFQGN